MRLIILITSVLAFQLDTDTICPKCTFKGEKLNCQDSAKTICPPDKICSLVMRSNGQKRQLETVCKDPDGF